MRMQNRFLWACVVALAVGCESKPATEQAAGFGRFEGDIVASWDSDGRNMTLQQEFTYVDPQDRRWVAPAGSVVNGASIPSGFWSLIGGPFEGRYRNASVVHDIGCDEMRESWEDVHKMFYEACLCGGVDEKQAKLLYYAVYHFGPRWEHVSQTQMELQRTEAGQVVEVPTVVQTAVRVEPTAPTVEEVQQAVEFIEEEKPSLTTMKAMNRDALHRRPRRGHSERGDFTHNSNRPGQAPTDRPRPEGAGNREQPNRGQASWEQSKREQADRGQANREQPKREQANREQANWGQDVARPNQGQRPYPKQDYRESARREVPSEFAQPPQEPTSEEPINREPPADPRVIHAQRSSRDGDTQR